MPFTYPLPASARRGLLLLALLLAAATAQAQAPGWDGALSCTTSQAGNLAVVEAIAADARGNVFVTGIFAGTMTFGNTVLTSAGPGTVDLFLAKYTPGTGTWAWAVRGGGTDNDYGYGVAVSGSSVYVTGVLVNDLANTNAATLGGTAPATPATSVRGASPLASQDVLLAKYLDNGSSATLAWAQVAGGTDDDAGRGVAVSGSSVYVTGILVNTSTNANAFVLGGNGTTPGTSPQYGASTTARADLLLAKYTDQGSTGRFVWSQVGGGSGFDVGYGVAASGSSVYVAGGLQNGQTNTLGVVFGGSGATPGTSPQYGATYQPSTDLLLAKYLDNGPTGTFSWSQVGGGVNGEYAQGVAVSGASVYVTGSLINSTTNQSQVLFGGSGSVPGTRVVRGATATNSGDLLLAKYTDAGASASLAWTQVAGGTNGELGSCVAVSGPSVYVGGFLRNNAANTSAVVFGGDGTTAGTRPQAGIGPSVAEDWLLARYLDQGATAAFQWSQVGGSDRTDYAQGVAVSGQQVYAGGVAATPATFGPSVLQSPGSSPLAVLTALTDPTLTPLPTRGASPTTLALYPNPAPGAATLTGATPGAAVQVLDALGRVAATATAGPDGTAILSGLAPGLHLVRVGAGSVRLAVE